MGWGDEVVAAGQAQRLFDEHGQRVQICACDGTPRWHDIWAGNLVIVQPGEDVGANVIRILRSGPGCRPYIVYPFNEQTGWTFNPAFKASEHIARIYLTPAECARGELAREKYGPYVLIEPFTKHGNFRWPLERWVHLVTSCLDLTFVQHTHADSVQVPGAHPERATFREACGLAASADVYVRSESGMCHAAAALGVKQVTIFGGCMDPDVMAGYPGQTVLSDTGPGSPCGSWRPCPHCMAAMGRLTVDRVAAALRERMQVREAA